jgi:hypothetical protein
MVSSRLFKSCSCYLELNYILEKTKHIPKLLIQGKKVYSKDSIYRLFKPSFEIYEGDTINYTDTLGLRQGKWIYFDSLNRISNITKIRDDRYSYEDEYFEYYPNNEIARYEYYLMERTNFNLIEHYDTSGVITHRWFTGGVDDNSGSINIEYKEYFDKKGKLIRRELIDIDNALFENGWWYE